MQTADLSSKVLQWFRAGLNLSGTTRTNGNTANAVSVVFAVGIVNTTLMDIVLYVDIKHITNTITDFVVAERFCNSEKSFCQIITISMNVKSRGHCIQRVWKDSSATSAQQ
jgi:hypothetical protein